MIEILGRALCGARASAKRMILSMSRLKETRQLAVDLEHEIKLLSKQRSTIGEGALRQKRNLSDKERAEFLALGERITIAEGQLAENAAALRAAEEANERDRTYRGDMTDADARAADLAARRAGIHLDGRSSGSHLTRPPGRTCAELFGAAAAHMDGWTSRAEYLQCIGRGLHDTRLRADAMQSGDIPSAGGFAVPVQVWGEWLDASLETEIVRSRCTTWPMVTSELDVPCLDDLDRSGGAVGGLTLQFVPQGGTPNIQAAKLRALRLKARKGMLFVEVPNELLADAPNFDTNLSALLVRVLSFGLDHRFLFGDGAAGPLGALASPAAITVPRTTSTMIIYEDLLAMFSRLTPGSVSRSVWLAHPSTIPQLGTLSVAVGTGGSVVPVMTSVDGSFTILTRPVIFSEKMRVLGLDADLALCDFAAYAVGVRRDASIDKSGHVGFQNDLQVYRLQIRVDGQPTISAPIAPLNGPTLSPFVVLAA